MNNNTSLPSLLRRHRTNVCVLLGLPIYFLFFAVIIRPTAMSQLLDMGRGLLTFNALMLTCIQLGVTLISRITMMVMRRHWVMNCPRYIVWSIMEAIAMASFMALYLTLMYRGAYPYFQMLGYCFLLGLMTWTGIYLMMIVSWITLRVEPEQEVVDDSNLIRFVDSTQRLKLMIASSAVLYVSAEENYVKINYLEADRLRTYSLRSSMRSLEALLQKHGLVRSHRSYFLNPRHVKLLRKDKDGSVVAEMDRTDVPSIPVSATYYEQVVRVL